MKELKVFKMDDCTWVIAESKEQAIEWYSEEFGISAEEMDVYEVSYKGIHEDAGYWGEINMSDFDTPQIGMFHNWQGMFCRFIFFRDVVKSWDGDVPAIIASTEA